MQFHRSGHVDHFARDNLPPAEQWPVIDLAKAGLSYPERLNAVTELVDAHVAAGRGERTAIIGDHLNWNYAALAERINRIANVLTRDLGMVPGHRVLLRAANTPMMVAAYLAVIKAGGVVVATMPMLRAKELVYPLRKARIALALSDHRLLDELQSAQAQAPELTRIVAFGAGDSELERLMAQPGYERFEPVDTASDDVCLIGFTSGTTGEPKGTMHFQRDLLVICDCYGAKVLKAEPDDRFVGSAPLAFTFGLGGMVLFPFRIGATAVLPDKTGPADLIDAIERHKASVIFTAPTAYRAMLDKLDGRDISSLRICVSAGETLPKPVFDAWQAKTALPLMDGIGATEMLHIFIAAPREAIRPGSTGIPVPGYEAIILDTEGHEAPDGTPGRLAVRGPIGCRYLADPRQAVYVQNGWNVTGDTYIRDADGYFWYQARSDDMIVSSGYNIAGPEVESSLLAHPDVMECGVVGAPCPERGQIVKAYVVLREGVAGDAAFAKALQDHVKATIAPYKYPRAIEFVPALPKTASGKLQRFALRQIARGEG
ncbi:benzoate-CoA ligase family protein [Bosea sp. (in: a-proteobacteria)]|uniref:benzoate-CoA ligase family protein n=1 Tax=Bosea sp. (in: a-proteobacteria) TaxID=1871050 RepID=UPI00120C0E09|nr:benzoate-CoA ligase family protein [Bosea sp. (in: a-proteobacteria)]TAJ30194.1 MAG: benzoate-CoA ligase family protein [Bosea sp. (in: a-proteobacteria)]